MKPEELRALLRRHTRSVGGVEVVDAIRLKNGQTLGVVIVGRPLAGSGVKLIIEEREHGKSNPKESTEAHREKDNAAQDEKESHEKEEREASRRRQESQGKGWPR